MADAEFVLKGTAFELSERGVALLMEDPDGRKLRVLVRPDALPRLLLAIENAGAAQKRIADQLAGEKPESLSVLEAAKIDLAAGGNESVILMVTTTEGFGLNLAVDQVRAASLARRLPLLLKSQMAPGERSN